MAGTIVQTAFAADDSGATSSTLQVTINGVTAGNTLVLCVGFSDTGTNDASSVTDGTSYTASGAKVRNATNGQSQRCFYLENATSGNKTITINFAESRAYRRVRVAEVSGLQTSSSLDQQAGNSQDSPGTSSNGVTSGATAATTNANDFVISFSQNISEVDPGTGTLSAGTGYTLSGSSVTIGIESKSVSTTGAQTATFTQSVNNARITHVLAFKESASPVTITPSAGSASLSGNTPAVLDYPKALTGSMTLSGIAALLQQGLVRMPSVAALAIQGNAASVTTGSGGTTLSPSVAALTLSPIPATIVSGLFCYPVAGSLLASTSSPLLTGVISTIAGSLSLSGSQAVVSQSGAIGPSSGALAFTITSPVISLGTIIRPSVGLIALNSLSPSLELGVPPPLTGSLAISGLAPAVITGFLIRPTAGALVLGSASASLVSGTVSNPSVASLAINGAVPSISTQGNIQPSSGSVLLASNQPTVTQAGNAAIAPLVTAMTLVGQYPEQIIDIIGIGTGALSITSISPLLVSGSWLTPAAGGASLSSIAPSVFNAYRISPNSGTLVIDGSAPNLGAAVQLSPPTGSTVLSGVQVSLSIVFLRSPSVGAVAFSGIQPRVLSSQLAAPSHGSIALTGSAPLQTFGILTPQRGTLLFGGDSPYLSITNPNTSMPGVGPDRRFKLWH